MSKTFEEWFQSIHATHEDKFSCERGWDARQEEIDKLKTELESVYQKLRDLGPIYQLSSCCSYDYVDLGEIFGEKAVVPLIRDRI